MPRNNPKLRVPVLAAAALVIGFSIADAIRTDTLDPT
jgi:hypothetical protein